MRLLNMFSKIVQIGANIFISDKMKTMKLVGLVIVEFSIPLRPGIRFNLLFPFLCVAVARCVCVCVRQTSLKMAFDNF